MIGLFQPPKKSPSKLWVVIMKAQPGLLRKMAWEAMQRVAQQHLPVQGAGRRMAAGAVLGIDLRLLLPCDPQDLLACIRRHGLRMGSKQPLLIRRRLSCSVSVQPSPRGSRRCRCTRALHVCGLHILP